MKADELERRRSAWTAMSELFLDTETRWYVPRIALSLLETGYDEPTLERIWTHEAVPEFAFNLLIVAGDWSWLDFDESRMLRRVKRRGVVARYFDRRLADVAAEVWAAALTLRRVLLNTPEPQRGLFVTLWGAFAHAWVEDDLCDVWFLDSQIEDIRATRFSFDECMRSLESDFLPAYSELLYGKEVGRRGPREKNVRELLLGAFPPDEQESSS